jgi:hypothetical protein
MTDTYIENEKDLKNFNLVTEDDINSLADYYEKICNEVSQYEKEKEIIKQKFKNFLKERNWNNYVDNKTKLSVRIEKIFREDVDKEKLKLILTPQQLINVTKKTQFEKISILTKNIMEKKKRLFKKRFG